MRTAGDAYVLGFSTPSYSPFRYGAEYGHTGPCVTCGIKVANEHSNREGGWCDRLRELGLTWLDDAGRTLLLEMGWRPPKQRY